MKPTEPFDFGPVKTPAFTDDRDRFVDRLAAWLLAWLHLETFGEFEAQAEAHESRGRPFAPPCYGPSSSA